MAMAIPTIFLATDKATSFRKKLVMGGVCDSYLLGLVYASLSSVNP